MPGWEPRQAGFSQALCSGLPSEGSAACLLPDLLPTDQVDIMQMCVVELKDRPGKPLFHLEHYIEGKYIKYNSNSGFVRDDNLRLTPQVRPLDGRVPVGMRSPLQSVLKSHETTQPASVSRPKVPAGLNRPPSFVFSSVQPFVARKAPLRAELGCYSPSLGGG